MVSSFKPASLKWDSSSCCEIKQMFLSFLCLQSMVIGPAGQLVAQIAHEVGEDLSRVFLRDVKLKLSVKLRK